MYQNSTQLSCPTSPTHILHKRNQVFMFSVPNFLQSLLLLPHCYCAAYMDSSLQTHDDKQKFLAAGTRRRKSYHVWVLLHQVASQEVQQSLGLLPAFHILLHILHTHTHKNPHFFFWWVGRWVAAGGKWLMDSSGSLSWLRMTLNNHTHTQRLTHTHASTPPPPPMENENKKKHFFLYTKKCRI